MIEHEIKCLKDDPDILKCCNLIMQLLKLNDINPQEALNSMIILIANIGCGAFQIIIKNLLNKYLNH